MTDLHPLIARLEAATGPDRELDREIALASGWRRKRANNEWCWKWNDNSWTEEGYDYPPQYSGSLDAALTLLPEGCGLELRRYWRAVPGIWWSSTLFMSAAPVKRIGAEDAPTAALALLTAILKARAAMEQPE